MNSNFERASRYSPTGVASASILAVILAVAASTISAPAHAEYRCATPERLSPAEKRACDLAKQDSPAALIHFVNRTKAIYALSVDDYVSKSDVQRWDLAARTGTPGSQAVANAPSSTNEHLKAR